MMQLRQIEENSSNLDGRVDCKVRNVVDRGMAYRPEWRAMGIHVTVVETACGSKYDVSSLFDDLNNLNNQLAND